MTNTLMWLFTSKSGTTVGLDEFLFFQGVLKLTYHAFSYFIYTHFYLHQYMCEYSNFKLV